MAETIDRNQWLGKIPDDWKLVKGRYIFKQRSERGNSIELQLLSPTQKYGVVPQSLYEELSGFSAVKLDEKTNLNTLKTIHFGDYCISLRSFQGGFEYSEYEGVCSPAYQIFYPTISIERRYYKYLFKDQCFIDKMNSFTLSLRDGKNIAFSDFGNTYLPVPPIDVQEKIANFLDDKCSDIGVLMKDIEKQIETLEEYKKSVITEAVTKGLNPDVEMKDSGIEWIGMIPKHWDVKRAKYACDSLSKGNGITKEDVKEDGNIQCVRYGEIYSKYNEAFESCASFTNLELIASPKYITKGDILFAGTGELVEEIGKNIVYMGTMPCLAGGDIVVMKHSQHPKFFNYALNSMYSQAQKSKGKAKLKVVHISATDIGNILVVIPPLKEQSEIAEMLDNKCYEINAAITEKLEQIEILELYKKSLIYEYVTGKKEVPEK